MEETTKCDVCEDRARLCLPMTGKLCPGHKPRQDIRTENYRRATLRGLAKDALRVQDACNLSGVLASAAEASCILRRVGGREGLGTLEVNRHPVMALYSAKIADLAGVVCDFPNEAEGQCRDILQLEDLTLPEWATHR